MNTLYRFRESRAYFALILLIVTGSLFFVAYVTDKQYKEKVIVQLPCGQRLTNTYDFNRTNIRSAKMSDDYQPNVFISMEANGFNYIEVRECR